MCVFKTCSCLALRVLQKVVLHDLHDKPEVVSFGQIVIVIVKWRFSAKFLGSVD